jgi:hypothetical protein
MTQQSEPRQVPEADDLPAEDATSPQVEQSGDRSQSEGDDDEEI